MTEHVKLIVKAGDEINKSFDLNKDKNFIGRDPKSDIVLDDIEISRNHVSIIRKGETFQIEDQNSTNGTFLNGRRLKKQSLIKNGDLISLGENYVLEFIYEKIDEIHESSRSGKPDQSEEIRIEEEASTVEKPVKERFLKKKSKVKKQKKEPVKKKTSDQKKPTWVIILFIALAFLVVFCVIPLIVIEASNQWCNLFAGFFNSMSPGVCP
jgi:pSer/pThr/pTyr-binding forkhead associated (FHA) protein